MTIILDFILPPRCFACGENSTLQGPICGACWNDLTFITKPYCAICGYPFSFESEPANDRSLLCSACLKKRPFFDNARAPLVYNEKSKALILSLKYNDNLGGVDYFATNMARLAMENAAKADFIVPVPIHWRRMMSRRYNQAALLGHAVSKKLGIEILPQALIRNRHTPQQGGLNHAQRRGNVARAFAVSKRVNHRIKGAHILLVDDVFTTGATVSECARTLKSAGAKQIDVLTIARVLHPQKYNV